MTITLKRDPSRADLFAVIDVVSEECTCTREAEVMKGESDKLLCKPCKVRKRWNELVDALDETNG